MPRPSTIEILRSAYPGRVSLSPREVAQALHGSDSKKRAERVRAALEAGTLIPGLRKDGARWRVPVAALAVAIDTRSAPPIDARAPSAPPSPRRRSSIGPRLLLDRKRRARDFWGAVLEGMQAELNRSQLDALAVAVCAPQGPRKGPKRP